MNNKCDHSQIDYCCVQTHFWISWWYITL